MNRKLWQKIGLDSKKNPSQDDIGDFSTIRIADTRKRMEEDNSNDQFAIFANDCSQKQVNVSELIAKPSRIRFNADDICVEMESCESEVLDSQDGSQIDIQIHDASSIHSPDEKLINQIKSLKLEVIFLHEENINIKKSVKEEVDKLLVFVKEQLMKYQEIVKTRQTGRKNEISQEDSRLSSCYKCQNQRKMLDNLTKQYWDLQQRMKAKVKETADLQAKLVKEEMKENDPIKKIEMGLMQERAETIRRLKYEMQGLKQESYNLRMFLQGKQNYIESMQANYKANLLELNKQIQYITQACSQKIQCILQDKNYLQNELNNLQNKYYCLQNEYMQLQKREQVLIRFNSNKNRQYRAERDNYRTKTEQPEIISIVSESAHNLSRLAQRQDYQTAKFKKSYPTNSMTQLINLQNNYNQQVSLRSLSRQNSERNSQKDYSPQRGGMIINNIDNAYKKDKMFNVSMEMKRKKTKIQNQHSNNTNITQASNGDNTFNRALISLAQIQRDVRKQINRSKLVCK